MIGIAGPLLRIPQMLRDEFEQQLWLLAPDFN